MLFKSCFGIQIHVEDPIESAAAFIHYNWMKRNPKNENNYRQHVPYNKLSEIEKQKDRDHINTIKHIIFENPQSIYGNDAKYYDRIANICGSIAHEKWRSGHEKQNGVGTPEMKSVSSGEQVNINCDWKSLHHEWKKENLEAGRASVIAYYKFVDFNKK